jgi:hypothetical protein
MSTHAHLASWFSIAASSLVVGCAPVATFEATRNSPRPMVPRPPSSVMIYKDGTPAPKGSVEVGFFLVAPNVSRTGEDKSTPRLKEQAGDIGCDALALSKVTVPVKIRGGSRQEERVRAGCLVMDPDADAPAASASAAPARACVPGLTQACVGPAGCSGGQACLGDGSGYSACDCGPAPATSDSAAPAASSAPPAASAAPVKPPGGKPARPM